MDSTTMDYIAKRYAEQIIESAIEDAAQDRVREAIDHQAIDDGLDLTPGELGTLHSKVYDLMVNATVTINQQGK